MNKQKWVLLSAGLLLMAGTGVLLSQLHAHQRLGPPGVKTSPIEGSTRLQVELPDRVLDYESQAVPVDKVTLGVLPEDTSFGQRVYGSRGGTQVLVNVVLMGADRTSLHKPQFCLEGAGWRIDEGGTAETKVHIERPMPYDLPVVKLVASRQLTQDGKTATWRCVYVYWFV